MKRQSVILTVLAVVAASSSLFAGDIKGKITFKGTPPPNPVIRDFATDLSCGKLVKKDEVIPYCVLGPGGELADVFVTIQEMSGKSTGASAPPVILDQTNCAYSPFVLALQTKQTLLVKNSDPLLHNVTVWPTPGSANKRASMAQLQGDPDLKLTFDAPEKFLRFKCDVHPWMFAYVCVVDHPYFSVSGEDGTFKIENVPPGKYTLEATHRKVGTLTKEVEVKDEAVNLELTFKAE